jgi:hypothetical protein
MTVTPLGMILVPVGLYLFLWRPRAVPLLLVFFTGFSASSVLNINAVTFGLQPYHFLAALFVGLFAIGAFRIRTTIFNQNVTVLTGLFFLAVLSSLLHRAILKEIDLGNITQTIILLVGLLTMVAVAFYFQEENQLIRGLQAFVTGGLFVGAWGTFQFVTSLTGLTYPAWIFNNSLSDSADLFTQTIDGTARISSVTIEPSFFARYMVGAIGVALTLARVAEGRVRSVYFILGFIFILLSVLSTSTSAYIGVATLVLLWVLGDLRQLVWASVMGGGAAITMSVLFPQRIAAIITTSADKSSSGSFYERTQSIIVGIHRFQESIFFGHGWDRLAVYDLVVALLFHTGLFGFVSFGCLSLYCLFGGSAARKHRDLGLSTDLLIAEIARGLQITFVAVLVVDAVSGISYVAANIWVIMGFLFAAHGARRTVLPNRAQRLGYFQPGIAN